MFASKIKNKLKGRYLNRISAFRESPVPKAAPSAESEQALETSSPTFPMASDDQVTRVVSQFSQQLGLLQGSPNYDNSKQTLLRNEREVAWDEAARASASGTEIHANKILAAIREHERYDTKLFGDKPGEAIPPKESRDMGGRFLVNKDRIDRSKIFEIAQHMPKGAHLHLHFNAELPAEVLLPHARSQAMQDTMCIRSTKPLLSNADYDDCEIVFDVLPKDIAHDDIFAADYDADPKTKAHPGWSERTAWMLWRDFRQRFPQDVYIDNLSGEDAGLDRAEQWVRDKMIITQKKAYADNQTTNGVWACFNQGTRAFKGLINYEGVYRWYIGQAIDSMIRDKVMYAELRPMLLDRDIPANDGVRRLDHVAQMKIICEELDRKEAELKEAGKLRLFPFGVKIIYCTPRSIPRERMQTELENCLKLKLRFPRLIRGFDLVGAEDRPNHIGFYADLLLAFTNTCTEIGVTIPFMFHAGESLLDTGGSSNPDNSNLYDSLLLNAKRVGHGYAILKHPTLVEKYKERKICLELCPISNEVLGLCGNIRQHRFPELLAAGLHCTLNADNPGLFRGPTLDSKSLSYEFYQVMVGDPRMSIHGWKQLAQWSIEHSCLDDTERLQLRDTFDQEWGSFCQWVVDSYQEM